jgi:hypothetical protein
MNDGIDRRLHSFALGVISMLLVLIYLTGLRGQEDPRAKVKRPETLALQGRDELAP